MDFINKMVERFIKLNRRLKQWQRVISVLSAIVVFVTTYALILPAITLDKDTASTQAGMEIAAEQIEPEETGTVYESEPEKTDVGSESEPAASEDAYAADYEDEEDSGSDSGSAAAEEAELEEEAAAPSEESDSAIDEENASESDGYSDAEGSFDQEPAEESDEQAGSGMTAEIAAEGETDLIAQEIPLITEQIQLFYENRDENDEVDYIVYAEFGEAARLPVGVELQVKEITKESDPEAYELYCRKALEEMKDRYDENTELSFANFYDISFVYDGAEVEPGGDVNIRIEYAKTVDIRQETSVDAIHFDKEDREKVDVIEAEINSEKKGDEESVKTVEFESDRFSVYGIVGTETIETTYLTADGETYKITVTYGPEAEIPEDAKLYVEELMGDEQATVESAIDAIRSEETRVAVSRTFDIKILNADGKEIQPAENAAVEVSFELAENQNRNLDTNIYHMTADGEEVKPQQMEVETKDGVATVVTDGFSYYTVEFTYNNLTYVLNGDSTVPLSEIMDYVGLSGEVSSVEVSDETLFMASKETGEWQVSALQPFSTDEWMKVTIDNIDFEISFLFKVTDAVELPPIYDGGTSNGVRQYGEPNTFLHQCEEPTIIILPDEVNVPDSVTVSDSRFRQDGSQISYHGTLNYYSENAFRNGQTGICTLTYNNAALLQDGSFADVQIKVTEARYFTKDRNSIGRAGQVTPATYPSTEYYLLQWDSVNGTRVLSGSSKTDFTNLRVGLEASLEISIVKNGSKVNGSFYYGMTDIDVSRATVGSMEGIYESARYFQFSEQVEIISGAISVAYIPVTGGDIGLNNGDYCCGISNNTGTDANGLLFTPGNEEGDNDPGTFCSGFALLADADGLNIKVRSAGGNQYIVNTTVSPPPIGSLYLRKKVINGTELDYRRNWDIKAEIKGSLFEDDQMKHDETVYVGAFMQGFPFTAEEIMPHDWEDYKTYWKVLDGVTGDVIDKGDNASASGTILPRTIVEFENERLWVENLLTIRKIVLNPGDGDLQKNWGFTLTLTDGNGDNALPIERLEKPEGAQNWTEVGDGKYSFTLKHNETIQITLPKGCNYSVQEDEDPDYYTTYDNQKGTLLTQTVATVYNMPKPEIRIKKENDKKQFISGAKFKLLYKNDSGSYVQVIPPEEGEDFEIPEDGYEIENMSPGEYKLVETEAPSGYIILTSEYEFKLELSNVDGKPSIRPVTPTQDVIIDDENLIITVKNYPGKVLPGTGGPGTLHHTLSGIALMLGAVWMYGFGMRRRVRR